MLEFAELLNFTEAMHDRLKEKGGGDIDDDYAWLLALVVLLSDG